MLTKAEIQREIDRLDYMKGTGILDTPKRQLVNKRFLFISSGGAGHRMLSALRTNLKRCVDRDELHAKVRFLAVDADYNELDNLVRTEGYSTDEVFKLPFEGARESINPENISEQMKKWVDPELFRVTGKLPAAASGFTGNGAGQWRQVGRVRLCQSQSITNLTSLITTHYMNLFAATNGIPDGLEVIFLSGIGGGTGSGTIIDLAFLTRQIISNHDPVPYTGSKTSFSAYLLLPSACNAGAIEQAWLNMDRNAYAALKEIDYFMSLRARKERYQLDYGTYPVDIGENIFDFCTLVEGVTDAGVFFDNAPETARGVTARFIMDLMMGVKHNFNRDCCLVDAIHHGPALGAHLAHVEQQSHQAWPRNSNYCYNVIGYARCVVPVDLITVYAANAVFNEVWSDYERHGYVSDDAVIQFLDVCMLDPKSVYNAAKNKTVQALKTTLSTNLDGLFREYGPYYMINFTKQAGIILQGEDYLITALQNVSRPPFLTNRDLWREAAAVYQNHIIPLISDTNNRLYDVYTQVLDALKDMLETNAGLITDTSEFQNQFQKSYSWSPIDLTSGENASQTVKDELIPQGQLNSMAKQFEQALCDKKDEWTGCRDKDHFAPVKEIRSFIYEQLAAIVNTTVEGFLLKQYGGPDAEVSNVPEAQDPQAFIPVHNAARAIVDHLITAAGALAQVKTEFSLSACSNKNFITLPKMKRLDKEIEAEAKTYDQNVEVYTTSATDEISFLRVYYGVPAWAFSWTGQAEHLYEASPEEVGLHIGKGLDGRPWAEYPDLGKSACARENTLRDEARRDMERARELGLVRDSSTHGAAIKTYSVYILPQDETLTVQELLDAASLERDRTYALSEVMERLEAAGRVRQEPVLYSTTVTSVPDYPIPEDLGWKFACEDLRRQIRRWTGLKAMIAAAEEILPLMDAHNAWSERFYKADRMQHLS